MAVGDVRFFKAQISGFNAQTLNPTSAGWTQLTGTGDLGQSATHLTIIDNGITRLILDKNVAGITATRLYGFNGTSWNLIAVSDGGGWDNPTITAVRRNDGRLIVLTATIGAASTCTLELRMARGIPAFGASIINLGTAGTLYLRLNDSSSPKTVLVGGGTPSASDGYGALGFGVVDATAQFHIAPRPAISGDVLAARSQDAGELLSIDGGGFSLDRWIISSDIVGGMKFFGWMPRIYGIGDGGSANVGNGAYGQLREAEDNYTVNVGSWSDTGTDANCSNSKRILNSPATAGAKVSWTINFPAAGIYYVMVAIASANPSSDGTFRLIVDGVNGTAQTAPNSDFSVTAAHKVFGPFTITSAGNKVVSYETVALGSLTTVALDHISIFPYQATSSTPTTAIFPKDLANSILRQVTL